MQICRKLYQYSLPLFKLTILTKGEQLRHNFLSMDINSSFMYAIFGFKPNQLCRLSKTPKVLP
ncbi:hypothetical protein AW942_14265 [Pseudomonas aeruginosa]|nr:hypothetical protein Z695_0114130 [Pseudomonas aeruginosa SG17M]KXC74833.1 hypothetical protein AW897_14690 [Pseudomonas aeruginosa]OFO93173.1 hypothetical protein HMPREF3014_11630 [Pseudomonas sp. HMSC065H01]OFR06294.1 hypothetical protein HMPREF2906_25270 [Pseudomonas sp. HMSC065H02]KXC91364.1 hypothetical protein AW899_15730 [Pseudomonas aeruginosa]